MNPRDDLCEVNAALLELVRLQLAGELDAATAWSTRRDMLSSVEAAWHDLSQDLTPEALASLQAVVAPVRISWRERWQNRPQLSWDFKWPSLKTITLPTLPAFKFRTMAPQQLISLLAQLPWWTLFLGLALVTFYYVSTL